MSLTNIKLKGQNEGFTIVELLIVVVVIAILAAITIVSYNGITNRANASAAAETAANLQKKAELFNSDGPNAAYPVKLSDLTGTAAITNSSPSSTTTPSNSWYIAPNTINVTATPGTAPTSANGKNTVQYQPCGIGASSTMPTTIATIVTITGGVITYFNFNGGTSQINVGQSSGTSGPSNFNVGCAVS